jgi:hypothetical protein
VRTLHWSAERKSITTLSSSLSFYLLTCLSIYSYHVSKDKKKNEKKKKENKRLFFVLFLRRPPSRLFAL